MSPTQKTNKFLQILRAGRELERFPLVRGPYIIGRAPSCDLVLRSAGIKPVHFLLEHSETLNSWILIDISNPNTESEGIVLSGEAHELLGLSFRWIEVAYESKPMEGSKLSDELQLSKSANLLSIENSVLEMAEIQDANSGVTEILHIPVQMQKKQMLKLPKVRQHLAFRWEASGLWKNVLDSFAQGGLLSEVQSNGRKISSNEYSALKHNDVLTIKTPHSTWVLRLRSKTQVPPVKAEPLFGKNLTRLLLFVFLPLTLLFAGLVIWLKNTEAPLPEAPPRVAKIEIQDLAPPPLPESKPVPPPPPPPPPEPTPVAKLGVEKMPVLKKPGQAAAPRFKAEAGKKTLGLNSPAPPARVDQLGVLGALNSGKPKGGEGVKPDLMINNNLVTESVSAESQTGAAINLKNPPAGSIGTGQGGVRGAKGDGLVAAQTRLRGNITPDSSSTGPLAIAGAKAGDSIGTALKGNGAGVGGGLATGDPNGKIGGLDGNDYEVSGGLDKETIRRVVAANRGKIRLCYDRVLMSKPGVAGKLLLTWHISPQGPVTSVGTRQNTTRDATLEDCVHSVVRSMLFPKATNGQATTVIYPFLFEAK